MTVRTHRARRRASGIVVVVLAALGVAAGSGSAMAATGTPDPQAFADPGRFHPAPVRLSEPVLHTEIFAEAARQYAEHYGVSVERARAVLTEQGRTAGLEEDLRNRLGEGFGQLSFDTESGRLQVLLSPSGDAAAAERILAEHGIGDAAIGRSAWSAAELDRATTLLARRLARPLAAGRVALRRAADVGLRVDVDPSASSDAVAAVHAAAKESQVAPVIRRRAVAQGRAATCGSTYCDAPLIAGQAYYSSAGSCSAGFKAYANGSANSYQLTAGHCVSAGRTNSTCNAAVTWCGAINVDVGGYFTGVGQYDGGVMQHTNPGFNNYAAIRTYGSWAPYDSYAVYGWANAYLNQWVCKTGYRTHSVQCGSVISTNNGYANIIFNTACTMGGDSGGPVFDPSNLYALAITTTLYNTGLNGPCDSTTQTGAQWVTNAMATLGLSGISTS